MSDKISKVRNFKLTASSVNLMSRFVRLARTHEIRDIRLQDQDLLIKMWFVVQKTGDERLKNLYTRILGELKSSLSEVESYVYQRKLPKLDAANDPHISPSGKERA